ncbi:glycosyltransferase family 2 protein [Candidatus Pelagibacter sp.]|nr:glycosyltransferase family 2 protein [Candidatus Pelagibacter sp.]
MSVNIPNKKIYGMVISYKSAPVLEHLYKRIDHKNFDKIYFFDDCSPDSSVEKAKQFDWIVIENQKNLGHGGNLKKALKTVFDDGADYGVEIHADNQYSPNEISKAKEMINENYDLIIGSRFVNKNPYLKDGMPFMRYVTNKFMSILTSKIFKIKLTEFHTGCKIFSKNFYQSIPIKNTSDNYLFSFEIILQASYFRKKYGEISISSSYEGYKTSCNYLNGFIYLMGNFKLMLLYILAKMKIYKAKTFQND